MKKIKTYQEFKKHTPEELFEYSNREDLTFEEGALFVQFCQRAIDECEDDDQKKPSHFLHLVVMTAKLQHFLLFLQPIKKCDEQQS